MLASNVWVPPPVEAIVTRGRLLGGKGRIKATNTSILPLGAQRTIRPANSTSDCIVSAVLEMEAKLSPSLGPWVRANFQMADPPATRSKQVVRGGVTNPPAQSPGWEPGSRGDESSASKATIEIDTSESMKWL